MIVTGTQRAGGAGKNRPRRAANPLPVEKRLKILAILKIFRQIDRATDSFRKESGLKCLDACGECCHNKFVTATTLELLPLASELNLTGTLKLWMSRVDYANSQSPCIFFRPQETFGLGRCLIYSFRPLVCRLFGFSARENKNGVYELMICGKIKERFPKEYEAGLTAAGLGRRDAPVSRDYIMRAYGISPQLAGDADNINRAFYKASEMVRFYADLFKKERNPSKTIKLFGSKL